MRFGQPLPRQGLALDPEVPMPGWYKVTLRRGAPASAVRIWLGRPSNEQGADRSPCWQATLNGAPYDVFNLWPQCARTPISREEHDRIVERNQTLDADSPFYDPIRPIDLATAPPPTF